MSLPILTGTDREMFDRFPPEITDRELGAFFTLTEDDLERIAAVHDPAARLTLAVEVGAVRWLGFIPDALEACPGPAVAYPAEQLNVDPDAVVPAGDSSERSRRRHRALAVSLAGFRATAPQDLNELGAWLAKRAVAHDAPSHLLREASNHLRDQALVRPGLTVLERIVSTARASATEAVARQLADRLSPALRRSLDGLLPVDLRYGMSTLAWTRSEARSATPQQILDQLDKLQALNNLDAAAFAVSDLEPNRVRLLAAIARRSTNQALERRDPVVRYPALYAFCAEQVGRLSDEIVDLFDQALGHGHARARRELEQRKLADAKATNEQVHLLAQLLDIVIDPSVPDQEVRKRIFQRLSRQRLQAAATEASRLARPLDDNHFAELDRRYTWTRSFTPRLLDTLTLTGDPSARALLGAIDVLRDLNRSGARSVPADAPTEFVPTRWRPYVIGKDGRIDRHQWELCLLSELRSALRAGRVTVAHSRRFQPIDTFLIPERAWATLRGEAYERLGLPGRPEDHLDELRVRLDRRRQDLDHELHRGESSVRIVDGELIVGRLPGADPIPEADELASQVAARLPLVHLAELLIEVDRWTGFTDELTHAGGARPRAAGLIEQRYAAIVAHACNLGLAAMAHAAGVSGYQLGWVTEWYLRTETLAAANARIVNYHHAHPLARAWGDGTFSSSDGKRYPVGVQSLEAQAVSRYFGRGRGVTFYSWTSDQHAHYATRVVRTTIRDATYVLDGILDNQTELNIEKHTTDTAGYSDIIFALFDLLGLEFTPRLAGLADKRLYHLGDRTDTPAARLLTHPIDTETIIARWDDLLRVAASLKQGTVTASLLVARVQAAGPQHPIALALREYGRLIKTLFVLRYLADETERRAIGRQLNKGEALHALHERLFFAGEQRVRVHTLDRQSVQAHCLHLVANAIITWNTVYMTRALEDLGLSGDEHLGRLSPALYAHICRTGTYNFDASSIPAEGLRPLRDPQAA